MLADSLHNAISAILEVAETEFTQEQRSVLNKLIAQEDNVLLAVCNVYEEVRLRTCHTHRQPLTIKTLKTQEQDLDDFVDSVRRLLGRQPRRSRPTGAKTDRYLPFANVLTAKHQT